MELKWKIVKYNSGINILQMKIVEVDFRFFDYLEEKRELISFETVFGDFVSVNFILPFINYSRVVEEEILKQPKNRKDIYIDFPILNEAKYPGKNKIMDLLTNRTATYSIGFSPHIILDGNKEIAKGGFEFTKNDLKPSQLLCFHVPKYSNSFRNCGDILIFILKYLQTHE